MTSEFDAAIVLASSMECATLRPMFIKPNRIAGSAQMSLDMFVAPECQSLTSPALRGTFRQRLASRVRALKGVTCLAIFLSVLPTARTQGSDAPSVERCPGAASWNRSHPTFPESPQSEPGSGAISDAELLEELQVRFESDQAARKKWLADPKNETLARSVGAIDAANLTWFRQLISEKGFPTAAQVGYEGVHFAWILLQHADKDPNLQSALLPVLEQRFAAGELAANDLARSADRVLVASGKPQRYGTQFDWWLSGEFTLPEPRIVAEIDTERSHLGLMPLADYACSIREEREKILLEEREKMK